MESLKTELATELERAKHKWHLDDKLKELLIQKRIDLIVEYASKVSEIIEKMNPSLHGAYTLAWIPQYQTAHRLNRHQITQAQETSAMVLAMTEFVNKNQLLLGKELALGWHRHNRAFDTLAAYLLEPASEMFLTQALRKELEVLHDDVQGLLEKTIGLSAGFLASQEEFGTAGSDGHARARQYFDEIKAQYSGKQAFP